MILCFHDSNHGKPLTCGIVPDFKCPLFSPLVVLAITQQTDAAVQGSVSIMAKTLPHAKHTFGIQANKRAAEMLSA